MGAVEQEGKVDLTSAYKKVVAQEKAAKSSTSAPKPTVSTEEYSKQVQEQLAKTGPEAGSYTDIQAGGQPSGTTTHLEKAGLIVPSVPTPTPSPIISKLAGGEELFSEDVWEPTATGRIGVEHTMKVAEELGVDLEKDKSMASRKKVVKALEAQGVNTGLAWNLARQASTASKQGAFKRLYGVDAFSSIKVTESKRVLSELANLRRGLESQAGLLADQYSEIATAYKNAGFYEKGGRGLTEAPMSPVPGVRSEDSLLRAQLRQQFELLRGQAEAIKSFETATKKGRAPSFSKIEPIIKHPELYSYIPLGGGLDLEKALRGGYSVNELQAMGVPEGALSQTQALMSLQEKGTVSKVYIDPETARPVPSSAPT